MLVERLLADLYSGRVEWRILVLYGADKHDILEPLEARQGRQAVQARLFVQPLVCHAELGQTAGVPPLFEEPHARIEELV